MIIIRKQKSIRKCRKAELISIIECLHAELREAKAELASLKALMHVEADSEELGRLVILTEESEQAS